MHSRLFKLVSNLLALWLVPTSVSYAAISTTDGNSTLLDFGGSVDPVCKVRTNFKNRSLRLDLTSNSRQRTSGIFIWCNTGQSQAQATYSSDNEGFLVNENGNTIPYLIQIPQTLDNASLATPKTVSQRAGSGLNGQDRGRNIRVVPQVNGFEYAGTYRDTIRVTVAIN